MLSQIIIEGDNSETEIYGYRRNKYKLCITWMLYFLTAFILRLIFHWLPRGYILLSHSRCPLEEADIVLCKDQYHQYWIHSVTLTLYSGQSIKRQCIRSQSNGNLATKKSRVRVQYNSDQVMRYFIHKKVKHIWDNKSGQFQKIQGLEEVPCIEFYQMMPLSTLEVERNTVKYGENFIDVKITPLIVLLFKEGLNPFYVFQICSFILWFLDNYNIYASCIIIMSVLSLSIQLYETRKNEKSLRETVVCSGESLVFRGNKEYTRLNARELVPGDVLEVPRSGCVMHCDAVLISGNCIVNESMLTGESVPVTKTPLPNPTGVVPFSEKTDILDDDLLDLKRHNRHILFCGTSIIQARNFDNESVIAVVIRTGYLTAKGELVRSILYPKPIDLKLNKDVLKFIVVLSFFALIGLIYTIIVMITRNVGVGKMIIRALDLVTIVVPPALPIAMTIGIVFAQSRLKKKSIFCISPNTINICGGINVACFDKTGTLTEDGLDLWGVLSSKADGSFSELVTDPIDLSMSPIIECMATCHSLTFINETLCGDPLDLKMFQSIKWDLQETEDGEVNVFQMSVPMIVSKKSCDKQGYEEEHHIGILRQFPFSSSLQRMAVITKLSSRANFNVYVKGSPEIMSNLCRKETLPRNFSSKLLELTRSGYRVIALAYRSMKVSYSKVMRIPRHEVECDLKFLGLLVMENRLKPETEHVIIELKQALIRPVMITGDNMLTALSVARDCEIIAETDKIVIVDARLSPDHSHAIVEFHYAEDLQRQVHEVSVFNNESGADDAHLKICIFDRSDFHLALSGRTWAIIKDHCPQLICKLVVKGSVFARFAPDQKTQIIEALQSVGYYVSMCGDGANDCGALKAAHAGISLSEAEASVASPFTSKIQNISCVPELIKEGRCALATSFGTFKFMAGYSFTQFVTVLILYWITANLGDFQFLFIDIIIITSLSVSSGYTKANNFLSTDTPSVRLLTGPMISSLVLQLTLNAIIQMLAYLYVVSQPWYFVPANTANGIIHASYANAAIFTVSAFQYLTLAIVFSRGPPFRQKIYTNYVFSINILVVLAVSLYVVFWPFRWLMNVLKLVPFPSLLVTTYLICLAIINFFMSYFIEYIIDNMTLRRQIFRLKLALFPQSVDQVEYERIREDINRNTSIWPPLIKSVSVQDMRPEIFIDSATIHSSHSAQDLTTYKDTDNCKDIDVLREELECDDSVSMTPTFLRKNKSNSNVTSL